jgi:nitrogen regulatory protein PII-like uncharacterized protein
LISFIRYNNSSKNIIINYININSTKNITTSTFYFLKYKGISIKRSKGYIYKSIIKHIIYYSFRFKL